MLPWEPSAGCPGTMLVQRRAAMRSYHLKCAITAIGRQDAALPNSTLQHCHYENIYQT
jgi:hypothetical protein